MIECSVLREHAATNQSDLRIRTKSMLCPFGRVYARRPSEAYPYRRATAPTSAKHQFLLDIADKVGPISNELRVDTPRTEKSGINLFRRVIIRAERPSRCCNQCLDRSNVG